MIKKIQTKDGEMLIPLKTCFKLFGDYEDRVSVKCYQCIEEKKNALGGYVYRYIPLRNVVAIKDEDGNWFAKDDYEKRD